MPPTVTGQSVEGFAARQMGAHPSPGAQGRRPEHHKTDPYAPDTVQPLVTGTPRIVLEKVLAMVEKTTANYLLCIFSFGDLAPEHAMRSLELFTREVMPSLRR